jgi:hypothetical protein
MSPGSVTGMSPSYSEPSPDYSMLINQNRLPRPSSNSPPLNNTQNLTTHIGSELTGLAPLLDFEEWQFNARYLSTSDNTPQTLMGQFIHLLQNNAREVCWTMKMTQAPEEFYDASRCTKCFSASLLLDDIKQSNKFGWLKFEFGVFSGRPGLQCWRGD